MRPFTVVPGMPLGSLFSISCSLAVALLVLWVPGTTARGLPKKCPNRFAVPLIFPVLILSAAFGLVGIVRPRVCRYASISKTLVRYALHGCLSPA